MCRTTGRPWASAAANTASDAATWPKRDSTMAVGRTCSISASTRRRAAGAPARPSSGPNVLSSISRTAASPAARDRASPSTKAMDCEAPHWSAKISRRTAASDANASLKAAVWSARSDAGMESGGPLPSLLAQSRPAATGARGRIAARTAPL